MKSVRLLYWLIEICQDSVPLSHTILSWELPRSDNMTIMTNLWRHSGRLLTNRPEWLHFGILREESERKSVFGGASGGQRKNVRFLEMKPAPSRNADFRSFNDGRFVFCIVTGQKIQKTGR